MTEGDFRATTSGDMEVRSKVWLEKSGRVAVSSWRVMLLESVRDAGSLSAACEKMNVPYRTAWYKLKEMEEELGVKLLETQSGGAAGGGSSLTREADEIVERFRRAYEGIEALVAERFGAEFADLELKGTL